LKLRFSPFAVTEAKKRSDRSFVWPLQKAEKDGNSYLGIIKSKAGCNRPPGFAPAPCAHRNGCEVKVEMQIRSQFQALHQQKHQAPTSKLQRNFKLQASKRTARIIGG
jgi:hypothetical protein